MNPSVYLDRIGYTGEVNRDAATLKALQRAHFMTVPYENLDILRGVPLKLDGESLFDKIVLRKRGGYCFELNGAFGHLLRALGYSVQDCMARFLLNETQIPMRRHRVLIVTVGEERYLCDVGVGIVSPIEPLKILENEIQTVGNEQYYLTFEPFFGWVVHQCFRGQWQRLFSFTEEPQLDIDYVMPSYYCENHPDSVFKAANMLAIYTPFGGKNTLNGNELTFWDEQGEHHETLMTPEAETEAYRKYFGIEL